MKNIKKLLVFGLLMVLLMSCGSNRSTSKKSKKQEEVTKEQYLYAQSDIIFDKYKKNNEGQVETN